MVHSKTYDIFFRSLALAVLFAMFWSVSLPALHSLNGTDPVTVEYFGPLTNGAEEESKESVNELEKDVKMRVIIAGMHIPLPGTSITTTSSEAYSIHHFIEIPYPPPETPEG